MLGLLLSGGVLPGRSPHGERGLKFEVLAAVQFVFESLPTRGAWIEIGVHLAAVLVFVVAPHTGSVD